MSDVPLNNTGSRNRRVALAVLLLLVGIALGWRFLGARRATPPEIPTEGLSNSAKISLTQAREQVLANRNDGPSWGQLALHFTAHGLDEQAATCLRVAHKLDPTEDRWPYLLGLYYLSQHQDTTQARDYFRIALACSHTSGSREAAIRHRLAEQYLTEQNTQEAERLYREQLARESKDPRAKHGLGVTLLATNRLPEAVPLFEAAADSPFFRRQATSNLALLYRRLEKPDLAAKFEGLAAGYPDDLTPPDPFVAEVANLRGGNRTGYERVESLQQAGRIAETIPILLQLVESDPDVRALVILGQNLTLVGRHKDAERFLRTACEKDPNHVQAALLLGTTLFDLSQEPNLTVDRRNQLLRESAEFSGKAVNLKPDLAVGHYSRAKSLESLGQQLEAIKHFRIATECRPESLLMQLGLAQALLEARQAKEAAVQLKVIEQLAPANDARIQKCREKLAALRVQ